MPNRIRPLRASQSRSRRESSSQSDSEPANTAPPPVRTPSTGSSFTTRSQHSISAIGGLLTQETGEMLPEPIVQTASSVDQRPAASGDTPPSPIADIDSQLQSQDLPVGEPFTQTFRLIENVRRFDQINADVPGTQPGPNQCELFPRCLVIAKTISALFSPIY
jgi:hypothetical protein